MTHSLLLGDLTLTGDSGFPDREHGFWFEVCAEGTDFGSPQATTSIVRSLLADGDLVRYDRDGNRLIPVRVRAHGPTLRAVAYGEAALRRASKVRNELTWQPPDLLAPPSVYQTHPSPMSSVQDGDWDLDELVRRVRTFRLELACAPFVRSAELVTVPALALGAYAPTSIDACSSAAGWTAIVDGVSSVPTVSGGSVGAEDTTPPKKVELIRSGTIAFGASKYLIVEVETNAVRMDVYALVSGKAVQFALVNARLLTTGWIQYVFDTLGVTATSLTFVVDGAVYGNVLMPTKLRVNDVARSTMPPQVSPRQTSRVIVPGGTERTPASIHVRSANGTSGNGLTIVHTSKADASGNAPDLMRWRVSGNTVSSNAATFSGSTEPIHPAGVTARMPVSTVPAGGYSLVAALKSSVVGTFAINWSLSSYNGGVTEGIEDGYTMMQFFDTTSWHFCDLALRTLPTVQAETGDVSATIFYSGGAATIIRDEVWLFGVGDDSALTVVNTAAPHLWLDSPSIATGTQPRVRGGSAADRSDQRHPGASLFAMGNHVLDADGTAVYVGTQGGDYPVIDSTHPLLWHSNAAI